MSRSDRLSQRLRAGEVIVIDGGMGSELQARGVPMNDEAWSAVANLTHQAVVREIHEDYIRAGADVIITNTYAAVRMPLTRAGFGDRVVEANRLAVEAALEARDRVGDGSVAIAGSMSLAGGADVMVRGRPSLEGDELLDSYREQAAALAEAGVDLIALEMIGSPTYGAPALQAAAETGLPVWLGVSCLAPEAGRLPTVGPPSVDLAELLQALLGPDVVAVTVMHTPIGVIDAALAVVRQHWSGPIGAYPETGQWAPPEWIFADISPELFALEAERWVAQGVQLVGGCCGIRPQHIRALKDRLPSQLPAGATR